MATLQGTGEAVTGHADLGAGIMTVSRRFAAKTMTNSQSDLAATKSRKHTNSNSSSDSALSAAKKCCRPGGKRTIIIEPALALMFTLVVSAAPLRSQYVYYAIGEKYNLTAHTVNSSTEEGSGCGNAQDTNSTAYLTQQKVQTEAAELNLILDLSADLPGLLVTLFMGTWTDNHGRKPALILPLIGVLLQCGVYVVQQVASLSLYVMIVGGVLNALSGGIGTFVNACYSYYSDTIPSADLGRRVIIADLIFGLVLAAMQVAMGYLIETLGYTYPYIIVMTGHVVNLLYVLFFVPESKAPVENKKPISITYIINSFKVMTKQRPGRGRIVLFLGIAGRCAFVFFVWPRRNIQTLFLLNSPLCWTPTLIGIVNAFSSVYGNACQLLMVLVLLPWLREHGCLLLSVTCAMASTLWFSLSSVTWMVFLTPVIGFTQGASLPILRAMLSTVVPPDEQGALFASLSATTTAIDLVGGVVFSVLYGSTLLVFKGTAFMVMAAGLGIALVILCFFRSEYLKKAERDSWIYKVPPSQLYTIS